jgi:LPS-assembly lipoprotein
MSSREPGLVGQSRPLFAAVAALLLTVVAGCTVRPLYGDVTAATGAPRSSASHALASVEVLPVDDRVGQEVRNHLIFLLTGGAGQPDKPAYTVSLRTASRATAAAVIQSSSADELEPTSSVVTVRATYNLMDADGKIVAAGSRSVQAAYDVSRQAFSALRGERDAQNRAARELAEQLRMAIAQDLERPSSTVAPELIDAPADIEGLPEDEDTDGLLSE